MLFENLEGKTIVDIQGAKKGSGDVYFTFSDGAKGHMYHAQDCCESVSLEDVCGDVEDLLNVPICKALEEQSRESSEGGTFTFYTLRTHKGTVTFRWYGSSNGYYSEEADFYYEEAPDVNN